MNPIRRRSRSVKLRDHEDRVQALERRIPEDYPVLNGAILEQITVQNTDEYEFGFTFPDPEPCEPPDCDPDGFLTVGNYLVLPEGFDALFKIYLHATLSGGNSNFGNYRTVVDGGDQDQHGKSHVWCSVEIWRDLAPFGFDTYRAWSAWGEHPPVGPSGLAQRYWWYHSLTAGIGVLDPTQDRYALLPLFVLDETLAGTATITGLLTVELLPPGQFQIPGTSGL